ncbi:MAG: transglutaminase-like domain-containing protein [Cellulosilyticaceae bacterium]
MKRLQIRGILILTIFFLFTTLVVAEEKSWLDSSQSNRGIIHVSYKGDTAKRAKLMVEKDKQKYTYDLIRKGEKESFPLQLGNGKYKLTVLENTEGTKYRVVESQTIDVKMDSQTDVYLNSVQNVNWSTDSQAIKNAIKLTQNSTDKGQKTQTLYENMIYQYKYDYDKLATLPTTYLPIIDATFKVKTGICYDFSSLYAAMLRSQGIPCKLVKGYSSNAEGYHAWNEMYDAKTQSWQIIDTTYDLQVIKKNPKVKKVKSTKDYQKVYEY